MTAMDKIGKKLKTFIKFILNHKVYLLIVIPIIAAIILAFVLISRLDGDRNPEQTTDATTGITTEATTEATTTDPMNSVSDTLGSTDSTTSSEPEQTTEARNPDIPLIVERKDLINIHLTTDDGIVLMTGVLEIPVFYNRNANPAISVINEDIYNYVNDMRSEIVNDCRPIAENDLTSDTPTVPFNCDVTCEVMLSSDTCVSVLFSSWIYTGGENSSVYREARTYSLADGSVLDYADLFGGYTETVTEKMRDKITQSISAEPEGFYPDYEGLVDFYELEKRWYLDEVEGLCVYYVPYELAGYDKGILTYTIPLGELNTYLVFNPAYTSFAE